MSQKIIIDTDHILTISSKINDTSNEITNSINSFKKISDDLSTNISDQNMTNFKLSFDDFIIKLSGLVTFYNSITTNLNNLAKEYDGLDSTDASELKEVANSQDGNI